MPVGYTGTFFLKKASNEKIKQRRKLGNYSEADVFNPFCGNTFDVYVRKLAVRCGFKDAHRHTARGARAAGITKLAQSSLNVPANTIKNHAGHKHLKTNLIYHRETNAGLQKKQAAIMNKARRKEDQSCSVQDFFNPVAKKEPIKKLTNHNVNNFPAYDYSYLYNPFPIHHPNPNPVHFYGHLIPYPSVLPNSHYSPYVVNNLPVSTAHKSKNVKMRKEDHSSVKNVFYGDVTITQSPVQPSDDRKPAATVKRIKNLYLKKVSMDDTSTITDTSFASTISTGTASVTPKKIEITPVKLATIPNPYAVKVNLSNTPKKPVEPKNHTVQTPRKKKKKSVTFDFSGIKNIHSAKFLQNNFVDNSYVVSDGSDCSDDVWESDFLTQPTI